MSFLQTQLRNIAWAKKQLLKEGFSAEDQELIFQEDLFFPKSSSELASTIGAIDQMVNNKILPENKQKIYVAMAQRSYNLYKNAAKEMRKDRIANEKAIKTDEIANAQDGTKVLKPKTWMQKNWGWLVGGLVLTATTITIIVVKRKQK